MACGCLHELQWPGGLALTLEWIGIPLTILRVVGLTNGYNFMDGVDSIAATQREPQDSTPNPNQLGQ